ncbi:hypothetical protein [Tenacibaculum aquimarinum]|uniref:hypothetical protein n=1 Tax=Tenacibaculum aquimarinum TaxID=2910675 RepID=UPI001F0A478A|nr:hypothetical protein [Tenacibaculum aquimarinum]MCH3883773.1 hypothetical protein [Tenacibaculum aquimarinum]
MKKILVLIAVVFTTNAFCLNNNIVEDPHTVLTSCGTSFEYDDSGMSIDEMFDAAESIEWLDCEGGREML